MTDVFDKELPLRLKRYLDLNRERLVRAQSVMTVKARKFLSLIPLFLNYNDPHLPGFKHNEELSKLRAEIQRQAELIQSQYLLITE